MWRHFCFALCLLFTAAPGRSEEHAPDFHLDPKFQHEVAAAGSPQSSLDERIEHWKKASKISKQGCAECLSEAAALEMRTGQYKDAAATAATLEALVKSPANKAYAELVEGVALMHLNHDKPKPDQLLAADAAFKAALVHDPKLHLAAYMDGRALAALSRDDEARGVFTAYSKSVAADDQFRVRAEHFAANPALARARMAPPFTVTTADGKSFTLDEMGGRVVLVDFWATWCGPCNEELPHIQHIAEEFAGQPFVLISVSWDSDEAKWRAFLDKHGMRWNQYRDADHRLSTAYGVNAIPHTFTIDADGILQDEKVGSGSDIEGKLRKLVAKARAVQPPVQTAVAAETPAGTK